MGVTASIDISAEQRQILLDLFSKHLPKTKVWAFGSRVKWTTRSNSDLDLVVFSSPEQSIQVSTLKEALEESNLPFRVDLLVWDRIPESFKRNIEESYVVLVGDMGFNTNSLSSMCELIVDCPHSTPEWTESGFIVLRNQNIKGGVLDLTTPSFTNEKDYLKRIKRAVPKYGDIVITREAPMGEVCMIPQGLNCCLGQRQVLLRPKNTINGKYLFWALQSPFVQQQISWNEGTGSTVSNVRIPVLEALKIPRLPKENLIAEILSSIADKIELNRQTNQTLEQIAQALFKSWFVDFDPVKAKVAAKQAGANAEQIEQAALCAISGKTPEQLAQLNPQILQQLKSTAALFPDALVDSELGGIPEGWDITVLGELLEFNPKRTLKSGTLAPYLDMKNVPIQGHLVDEVCLREMASGTKFINGDTLLARITPCLENGKTAYVDFLEKDQIGWGSTEFIVLRPRNGRPTSLGYIIARLDTFRAKAIQTMTGTSGRQRASAQAIAEQLWINYPIELLNIYDLVAGCHLKKAKSNGDENNILSKLRDSLLPKLLSGELDLSNWDEPTVFNRDVGTGCDLSLRLNLPNVE